MHCELKHFLLVCVLMVGCLSACKNNPKEELTPWGTPMNRPAEQTDAADYALEDIQQSGQLIMLTISGPQTYYEYRGIGMGTQFLLCERFAQEIGVSLRVELCRDTAEMVTKLNAGEGDLIAYPLPKGLKNVIYCADRWAVREGNTQLADTLNHWYKPAYLAEINQREKASVGAGSIQRHVYSPMLDRASGTISQYDALFRKYSAVCRWDWRLLAAQCYQESCFDKNAHSWAGACGLMQIMPSTADHLSLPRGQMYEPEPNIAAAARYIKELDGLLSDIPGFEERQLFVLASYNGGYHHIRDAMALARKYGRNPKRWVEVAGFVLHLREPQFYTDPVVRHGYMRGDETVNYVARIHSRYANYRGVPSTNLPTATPLPSGSASQSSASGSLPSGSGSLPSVSGPSIPQGTTGPGIPQPASKKHRFDVN